MQPVLIETFEVRGLRLAFRQWGAKKDSALIFLHGFLDHGSSFSEVAEALSTDHHCVALDFRGFGSSGWIGSGGYYHFTDYFLDVVRLVETLGVSSVGFVAHSMGGTVALGVLPHLPVAVSRVLLLEGMGPPAEDPAEASRHLGRHLASLSKRELAGDVQERRQARKPMLDVSAAAVRLRDYNPRLTVARARSLAEAGTEPLAGPEDQRVVWRFDPLHRTPSARAFNPIEHGSLLTRVSVPVLALYGAESAWQLQALADRHRALRDLRVRLVEGADHNIHHCRPDLVAKAAAIWFGPDPSLPLPPGLTVV